MEVPEQPSCVMDGEITLSQPHGAIGAMGGEHLVTSVLLLFASMNHVSVLTIGFGTIAMPFQTDTTILMIISTFFLSIRYYSYGNYYPQVLNHVGMVVKRPLMLSGHRQ